jgi:hypothetical protein
VVLLNSPTLLLTVPRANTPVPVAHSLSRTSAVHGGWNFTLMVQGSGFFPGSVVTWNGKPLFAQYIGSTQLKLYVPWNELVSKGTASIAVTNSSKAASKSASKPAPLAFIIK